VIGKPVMGKLMVIFPGITQRHWNRGQIWSVYCWPLACFLQIIAFVATAEDIEDLLGKTVSEGVSQLNLKPDK